MTWGPHAWGPVAWGALALCNGGMAPACAQGNQPASANLIVADSAMAAPRPALAKPEVLVQNGDFSGPLEGSWHVTGTVAPALQIVPVRVGPYTRAARLQTTVLPESKVWDAVLSGARIPRRIAQGESIGVRVWMRSAERAKVSLCYQLARAPYTKSVFKVQALTPEWQEYRYLDTARQTFEPGDSNFELHLGWGSGTVEVAGLRVENFGTTTPERWEAAYGPLTRRDYYAGQQWDPNWRQAALQRIEKVRKANFKLRLVDERGRPIGGAKVRFRQKRQAFRWGSAVRASWLQPSTDPNAVRYRQELARLYNTAVLESDMKWGLWKQPSAAAEEAKRPEVLARANIALDWLQSQGIQVRGHTLVWGAPEFLPLALLNQPPATQRRMLQEHIADYAGRFKGRLYVWDVVNEAAVHTWLWDRIGWDQFAAAYKWTRQADPKALLCYNDYNLSNESEDPPRTRAHRELVKQRVAYLKQQGAPVDLLGDQAHIGVPLTPAPRALAVWDEMNAATGLPLEITEFDAAVPDDEVHGQYVEDYLLAAFSHPQVQGVILWGFWEGAHWRSAEGGSMFRMDWSKRPAQVAYEKLVLKEWMTDQTVTAAKDGVAQGRGFLGDYEVTISAGGKSRVVPMHLEKNGWRAQLPLTTAR